MQPHSLRTLGGLELEGSTFRRPKNLLLLAFLALEGVKTRRTLAEWFYPDARDPRDSLATAIGNLKRAAAGVIETEGDRVWAVVTCDAKEALDALDAGRLLEAVEVYRGVFLEGFDLSLGEELEEWVFSTREILAGRVRKALLSLAEAEAVRGDFERAAERAERAHRLGGAAEPDPDELERVHALLLAGASGGAADVRREAEEFGIDLPRSIEDARARFNRTSGVASPAGLAPHNLPTERASFVGRTRELIEIARLLAEPECRLLTLHGPGGVGKSRLAVQAASQQLHEARFRDGVHLILLDSLTRGEQIPASLAGALGLEFGMPEDALSGVKRKIGDREILLVFDNFEHLVDAAVLVSELLAFCSRLKILVTSRDRLNLEEEWVFEVGGLPVPAQDPTVSPGDRPSDALELFVARAKRSRLDFSLTRENVRAVLEICRLVEGSPLGIELAAAWIKALPPEDIAREIGLGLSFLTSPARNVQERHRSLQATIEHSWGRLAPRDQQTLRSLAVFLGGFRREHAAEVTGATLPTLAGLVDRSLLRVGPTGRYDRHPLILQFTRERLAEHPDEEREAQRRHRALFTAYVKNRLAQLTTGSLATLRELSEELDNIRMAWESAEGAEVLELFWAVHPYQERRGLWKDALAWAERGLEVARALGRDEEAGRLLHVIGMHYRRFWEGDKAIDYLSRSLEIEEAHSDRGSVARTHIEIGWSHYRLNRWEEAVESFLAAGEIAEALADPSLRATVDHGFGLVALKQGRLGAALAHLETGWRLARQHAEDPTLLARISGDLGMVHRLLGDRAKSVEYLKAAEAIFEELDNSSDLIMNHYELATTYSKFGDYALAADHFRRVLELTVGPEHMRIHAAAFLGLAETCLATQNMEGGMAFAEEALRLAELSADGALKGHCVLLMGELCYSLGQTEKAHFWLSQAVSLLGEAREEEALADALDTIRAVEAHDHNG